MMDARYIRDIVNGLVPSDSTFEAITASLERHGLNDKMGLELASANEIQDCANEIRKIRESK